MKPFLLLSISLVGMACSQEKTPPSSASAVAEPASSPSLNLETTASGISIPMAVVPMRVAGYEKQAQDLGELIARDLNLPGWFEAKTASSASGLGIYYELLPAPNGVLLRLMWKDGSQVLLEEQSAISTSSIPDRVRAFLQKVIKEFHQEYAALQSRILYLSGTGKNRDLAVMAWDGEASRVLAQDLGRASYPAYAADRQSVYYSSMQPGYSALFKLDLATGKRSQLRTGHQDIQPRPSPNGRSLLFSELVVDDADLWIMDLRDGSVSPLVRHPSAETSASWSPNGQEVYFSSDRGGGPQIYKVNSDGTELSRVSFRGRYNTGAALSPKGDKMAFSRMEGSRMVLYVQDLRTGEERQLTNLGNNDSPSWSPDGRMITFCSDRSGRSQIYLIRADGSGLYQLTRGAGASFPSWSN